MNPQEQDATTPRSQIEAAGDELVTWLDFYVNVCAATQNDEHKGYNEIARKAIRAWERLVPPKERD